MPERILIYLYAIDWKFWLGSVTAAIAIPYIDLLARFCLPIVSGIVWVFLKPKVQEWKTKYKGVSFWSLVWKKLVSIKDLIKNK